MKRIELVLEIDDGVRLIDNADVGSDRHRTEWELVNSMVEIARDFLSDEQLSWFYYYAGVAKLSPGVKIECPELEGRITFNEYTYE
jgi:hypothetical protein